MIRDNRIKKVISEFREKVILTMVEEETKRIMEEHDLDEEDAEKMQEIAEENGIDEDDALEILENL